MINSRKGLKIAALILGGLLLIYCILAVFPRGNNYSSANTMRKDGDMPILIAHGGGNKEFPETHWKHSTMHTVWIPGL